MPKGNPGWGFTKSGRAGREPKEGMVYVKCKRQREEAGKASAHWLRWAMCLSGQYGCSLDLRTKENL